MENESEGQNTLEMVRQYAGLFLRWSWLLILVAGISGLFAYLNSARQMPMYRTTTLVMVKTGTPSEYDYYSSIYYGQQLIDTYAKVMTTESVLEELSNLLGYRVNAGMFKVEPVENTMLMTITVTDTNPARAALIANTIVGIFTRQIQADQSAYYVQARKNLEEQLEETSGQIRNLTEELTSLGDDPQYTIRRNQVENNLSQYQNNEYYLRQSIRQMEQAEISSAFNIIQKDPAQIPTAPFSPQPMRDATSAGMIGFFFAAAVILLIELLNDKIRDPQEITRKWNLPIMGTVASFDDGDGGLITIKQPRSPVSEAFRALRTNLQFFSIDNSLRTIVISSSTPGEGKTTIAANLAAVIAQSNQSVVLVDADLRLPKVHTILGVSNRVGLTDQFIRTGDYLSKGIKPSGVRDLSVITSGNLPPNPSELLSTDKMQDIINNLKDKFKTVIFDTPPVLAVSDACTLAARVDAVLLVVKPSVTKRKELAHTIEQLNKVNANLLGVVINGVNIKKSSVYYRTYYKGSEEKINSESAEVGNLPATTAKPAEIQDDAL